MNMTKTENITISLRIDEKWNVYLLCADGAIENKCHGTYTTYTISTCMLRPNDGAIFSVIGIQLSMRRRKNQAIDKDGSERESSFDRGTSTDRESTK